MPKRTDIESILVIGAGPIIIGQACEFDYSGTQACRALREEGYRVILVNSNPATIMTDPELADATYIEPVTPEMVAQIIEKERPDAILPTMGGQTGLNTALSLDRDGILAAYGVLMIGANRSAIDKAEDRELFNQAMARIGLETARGGVARSLEEARELRQRVGLPAIIRPSFTLGGTGGGIAYSDATFDAVVAAGLEASPTGEALIEESVLGWKEYEMEVVRDCNDNCIIICAIENIDPMGVHTGDSITVAPALTLTDKEYQIMRDASIAVLREIGVETGGSNVQFAINPKDGRMLVIETNPRVSRSSALASKATGFPIAKIAAKLAVGYSLDELDNDITGVTPASFEPSIDYVVVKVPRFAFEKFKGSDPELTSSMKSVGEAMAIGRNFPEALQKALRSMEIGLDGLDWVAIDENGDPQACLRTALSKATAERLLVIAQALRQGMTIDEINAITHYDPWFLGQIARIIDAEATLHRNGPPQDAIGWQMIKSLGFSDSRIATLTGQTPDQITKARHQQNIRPVFKRIDTCAAEFPSRTPYMYSTYETAPWGQQPECEAEPSQRQKAIILGGGPNRIGQGIEFDYCCVHAAYALKEAGYEAIMVNCNPETVSTDCDTSDRLYFEPLTEENVMELIAVEQSSGDVAGVIVQLGGQTPLKLAHYLEAAGIPILGTSPEAIDRAEDRERFQELLKSLGLQQPRNAIANSLEDAVHAAETVGYPLVIRPSYVLGGRAMEIVHDETQLRRYMGEATQVSGDSPVLIDSYLSGAVEIDVDALCDREQVYIAGVMEHIEEAGIHSGDSACSLPPFSLSAALITELESQTEKLALALGVVGLINVQFAVKDGVVYVLEVNPRASRTVPFVAKVTGLPVTKIATRLMIGEKLCAFSLPKNRPQHVAVKESVFPFARFPGVDVILGPEMKSTGEVAGLGRDFAHAFAKAQLGAGITLPKQGTAFISVRDADKKAMIAAGKALTAMDFSLIATQGTARFLETNGLKVRTINKFQQGAPHIVDAIENGQIDVVINTTEGARAIADSFSLRRAALLNKIPYYTTVGGALAAVEAIKALREDDLAVASLQSYFEK